MLQWFSDSLKSLNSVKVLFYLGKTPMGIKINDGLGKLIIIRAIQVLVYANKWI